MSPTCMALSPADPDPPVTCDRGVALVPAADRRQQAPDRTLLLVDGGSLVARCSCWWSGTPQGDGGQLGVIGHYAAADIDSGRALLSGACDLLASRGVAAAVGPMDGSTWRRYRLIVDRGDEPVFFLEPDNPDEWVPHWTGSGFTPRATYVSAVNSDLHAEDPRTENVLERLAERGVRVRAFDSARADVELRRLFKLSLSAFSRNLFYTPISEDEFMAQYRAVLPHVHADLVLLAERGEALVGFVFAVPDLLQARRGATLDTVVVKTVAVDPALGGAGLGGALVDLLHRRARAMGFRRAIHALMHEANFSRNISSRSAATIRRYALFSRSLRG